VTDRIIAMLENGVAPWQKPWNPGEASVRMPFNPTTERSYRGGNVIHLMATRLRHGYADPRWIEAQFAERKIEPNSGLGKAITYLLRHWKALTLFLRQAGVPLDDNIVTAARGSAKMQR
jgi:hypothetical protein